MSDPMLEPFSAAEARLATRLQRWSDRGVVPIDATDIARRSTRATGRHPAATVHRLGGVGSRRMVLGVAAVLTLALGLALAAAATLPSPTPAVSDRAVVTRQAADGVDVVLVRPDGTERLLRHVTAASLGLPDGSEILPVASLGRHGWLEVHAIPSTPDRSGPAPYGHDVLIDLADPARQPIVLAANGFMSGVWGPDGRYAHYDHVRTSATRTAKGGPIKGGPTSGGDVTVIDPEAGAGSAVTVPSVQTFGSGPVIVWMADGSGFLARQGTRWGTKSIETGAYAPGVPSVPAGWLDIWRTGTSDPTFGLGDDPWGAADLFEVEVMAAVPTADGAGLWQQLGSPDSTRSQAVLVKLTGPGTVASVHTFDLPAGQAVRFTLSSDDALVAFDLGLPDRETFVLALVGPGDEHIPTGPVIEGFLAGMAPGAEADAWPGP